MKPKFLLQVALMLMCGASLSAQTSPAQAHIDSLKQSHHVILFGEGEAVSQDSIQNLINQFYIDQFRHSLEPDAPHFLFMSKDGNMAMGIGGRLQVKGWYDWGAYNSAGGFVVADIPVGSGNNDSKALRGNVNGSRLYFKVLGNHKKLGNYQVYLEAKFNGGPSKRAFKLSKAYATINDWTVGYTNSTFEDPAAQPYTIDVQGPNAEIGNTDVLVRWMHNLDKSNVIAASLEMPNADDVAATDYYSGSTGWLPNVAAFYQYQWSGGSHIRLAGIMRFLPYRDLVASDNKTTLGWGVKASTVFTPGDGPMTVYLNALYGKGIAGLTNDLSDQGLDLMGMAGDTGEMYAPAVFGYFGGLQYNFSDALFTSASFSQLRLLPDGNVGPDTYRYGLYGAWNLCWYVTHRFMVGGEVDLGMLKEFSGKSQWAHRAGVIAQLSF